MAEAKRDGNYITTLLAVSNADGSTPVTLYADPTTHRLLVSATAGTLDDLSDVVITSGAQGDILYNNGTNWVNLAAGTNGHFLKTQGAGANPTWAAATATITGTDTHVTFFDGANNPAGDAGFTYNKTTDTATLAGNLQCEDLLIEDSDASHYLTITTTSNLTAARTLTLVPGDASRTLTISGDATVSQDYSTAGNPQFATIELGHASDTTLARSAAGQVTIEGVQIDTASNTITLTNKTLTSPTINGTIATTGLTLPAITLGGAITGGSQNVSGLGTVGSGAITSTGLLTVSLAGNTIRAVNTTDNASVQVAKFEGDRATVADNDEGYVSFILSDDAGNQDEQARLTWKATTVANGATQDGQIILSTLLNGSITTILTLGGATSASTFAGNLSIGTSNAFTTGTIEVGAASDTTISRSSAGIIAVEGVAVPTISSTDTLSNKTLTAPKIANAGFIADANGNEQIIFNTTASAVNEVAITNAATGTTGPLIAASGETNVDLRLAGKGTGAVHITTGSYGDLTADTDGATITFNLATSNIHTVTLGGNRTLAISNAHVGQCFMLRLLQDGTGSRTVTWFTTIKWAGGSAPTLTTTANKADMLGFVVTSAGNYDGFVVGANI